MSRISSSHRIPDCVTALVEMVALFLAAPFLAALFFAALILAADIASAQAPAGVIGAGEAAVSGFSGPIGPTSVAPGVDPADQTVIDPNGWSIRVFDLSNPGGPPQAQLIAAPKRFSTIAAQTGQLFGLALDNANPPNIYAGATSIYGLPLLASDTGVRLKTGAPNAVFMNALFGPAAAGGGPGSIWRIDGRTGEVRLFANVATGNSGPALGGLAFDPGTGSLFAVDRETGLIFGYDLNGQERGRFDHGVTGRQAAGLPPVAFDPAGKLDIAKPAFDTQNPATWGYAARERLVFGLGINAGRLYYGVADGLQVWSVSISSNGAFGGDPRLEIAVPPGDAPTEISKIVFDGRGRMILGERASPTGAYDFMALAQEGVGRALRFSRTPEGAWAPAPDEYAIGFPLKLRNGNGGVAIGYDYLPDGRINYGACGGFLWSTGEQLRVSPDPAIAQRLRALGPEIVNGLQGNNLESVRPRNAPPFETYFADYDDRFDNPYARGHMGDIVIPLACSPRAGFAPLFGGGWVEGFVLPPGLECRPGETCACQPGRVCCPPYQTPDRNGICRSLCQNPRTDVASNELCYRGIQPPQQPPPSTQQPTPPRTPSVSAAFDVATATCWDGSKPNVTGGGHCPRPPGAICPAGHELQPAARRAGDIWSDYTCTPTPPQRNCDQQSTAGNRLWAGHDGRCQPGCPNGFTFDTQVCCPQGTVVDRYGRCGCPDGRPIVNGQCPPPCPPGLTYANGKCGCPDGRPATNGQCPKPCEPGLTYNNGQCGCPDGARPVDGRCVPPTCPQGTIRTPNGCTPPPGIPICPPGQVWSVDGCGPPHVVCPVGQILRGDDTCGPPQTNACPTSTVMRSDGQCCPPPGAKLTTGNACICPPGSTFDGRKCGQTGAPPPPPPIEPVRPMCMPGYTKARSGECCRQDQLTAGQVCCPPDKMVSANGRVCVTRPKASGPTIFAPPPAPIVLPPPPHLVPPPHYKPPVLVVPPRVTPPYGAPPVRIKPPVTRPPARIGPPITGPRGPAPKIYPAQPYRPSSGGGQTFHPNAGFGGGFHPNTGYGGPTMR